MSVELKGFDEFAKKLIDAREKLQISKVQTIEDILKIGKDVAQKDCPKVTFNLHDNIRYEIGSDGVSGTLISGATYSRWVNDGTSDTKAVPFFTNAIITMNIQLYLILKKNVREGLKGTIQRKTYDRGKEKKMTPKQHKYLYYKYTRSGARQYVFPKGITGARGTRAGVTKTRGRLYRGRTYRRRFEAT